MVRKKIQVTFPYTVDAMQTAIAMFLETDEFRHPSEKQCRWALREMYRNYGMGWDEQVIDKDLERYDWALKVIAYHWDLGDGDKPQDTSSQEVMEGGE